MGFDLSRNLDILSDKAENCLKKSVSKRVCLYKSLRNRNTIVQIIIENKDEREEIRELNNKLIVKEDEEEIWQYQILTQVR